MKDESTTNSHYLTDTFLSNGDGGMNFLSLWKLASGRQTIHEKLRAERVKLYPFKHRRFPIHLRGCPRDVMFDSTQSLTFPRGRSSYRFLPVLTNVRMSGLDRSWGLSRGTGGRTAAPCRHRPIPRSAPSPPQCFRTARPKVEVRG